MTVHILHDGFTLCGFGRNQFPGAWPGNHRWTYLWDRENVSCRKCLELRDEIPKKKAHSFLPEGY